MLPAKSQVLPSRRDDRVILHFDYDCFYASVFEAENPTLKAEPLAVQQKQIIVTCNYEARRRGLRKLQLIKDARRICPDVIIVLGEDISRFRDASKTLYQFLRSFSWNDRAERLGFDEVWLDITDMIEYNISLLNPHDLVQSFFVLQKDDPTQGFAFNATCYAGPTVPDNASTNDEPLSLRLKLGSHLAFYIRTELERRTGYTSTVGISTSKLLSKLVGNMHKPKDQTTLIPPYACQEGQVSNVESFIDDYEIGKIPGIGSKLAHRIRQHILQHEPDFEKGLVYGETKENVTVKEVRLAEGMSPETLDKVLAGPGSPHGIGIKMWALLHGVDDTEVSFAKAVPSQISIEDSYIRLDTLPELLKQLKMLSCRLIERMRIDLVTSDDSRIRLPGKWLAHPKTIRLSTRPRLPLNPDGTRSRSFKRISHSAPLPNYVLSLTDNIDVLAERLVNDTLIAMFRKLHPEKAGWNLSLVNLAVTNMAEAGGESKTANGRDISSMFKRQESVHKEFTAYADEQSTPQAELVPRTKMEEGYSHLVDSTVELEDNSWVEEEDEDNERCGICGMSVPLFAMQAHMRFHEVDR
ncbi:DNA/RNA polymerase [Aureobasidium namibiae CBS 147.97]|uniref:DNA/RNA polymerase n=1 Tax=Aureobasidium namibiae CBS 147.97 TaxID=1043004 RepID=A0A074WDU6_9PEZI|nr:DNA/RNA polymerase [Aureobasidium namibiae CBS 147.97]KEQ71285.1 DNA/RNA polymerase [Aureobasidium namibiae CBS 147.97]